MTDRPYAAAADGADPDGRIAVVGLDCRVPGARDHHEFWRNLLAGTDQIRDVDEEQLVAAGVEPRTLADPRYVRRAATVEDTDLFDASFFYLSAREAERMDPQLRLFLQSSWKALEHSGHDSEQYEGRIGVFAGALSSTYLLHNVLTGEKGFGGSLPKLRQDLSALMGNDPNHLATRASYHLNLTGPSVSVQTACSTSLVAVHQAAQSLLGQECDVALAGGVALRFPQEAGYLHESDSIASATGTVRPFDAHADGTVFGNGVGVVVLKRLSDALADGDTVWAVLRGSAIGNDGADRVGYTAPGVTGQAAVLAEALAVADVDPATVSYLEAHGTGTRMGDPVELAAAAQSYQVDGAPPLTIGSVKANLGHLSTAAGIASLIKCVLMLYHRTLVPTPHFTEWNPQCEADGTRFRVGTETKPWQAPADGGPLRCAVTSTGMGGTTAHVVLEEAPRTDPAARPAAPAAPVVLLPLSAKSPAALERARQELADHLEAAAPVQDTPEVLDAAAQEDAPAQEEAPARPGDAAGKDAPEGLGDTALEDAAHTLATARRTFNHRAVITAPDRETAVRALRSGDPRFTHQDSGQPADRPVVLLFPGQGTQHPGMGQGWYEHLPVFRRVLDECAELLEPHLGLDLRDALYPRLREYTGTPYDLGRTRLTQPALFAVEYALARQWAAWGVRPAALAGHSVGEYVAATLAGVFTLPDALRVIAERGRLVDALPGGVMAAVMLPPAELAPYLEGNPDDPDDPTAGQVALAAVNEPAVCTVAGPKDAVRALTARLTADGVAHRKVVTSHAFHSAMMDPAVGPLTELLRGVRLRRPEIPFLSNRTGTWITDEQATDPAYWGGHLRETVRFADSLATVLDGEVPVFLEVGPGQTLATFTRRHPDRETGVPVVTSAARGRDAGADLTAVTAALGRLWAAGLPVDWRGYYAGRGRGRVPLPTYPFEGTRYWVEPGTGTLTGAGTAAGNGVRKLPLDQWFSAPVWRPAVGTLDSAAAPVTDPVLLFADEQGTAARIAAHAFEGEVLTVRAGAAYGRDGDTWTLRPDSEEDHTRLVADLLADERLPDRVLHAWSTAPLPAERGKERFECAQRHGLYSLIALVKAFSEQGVSKPLQLDLISAGAYAVSPAEPEPAAELVTLAVAARVIGQEHGNIGARHFDLPAAVDEHSVRTLAAELAAHRRPEVATTLRGGTRWITDLAPVRADWTAKAASRLREDGVYLITGGLGEIGSTLAHWLRRECPGARLALLTRDPLPDRTEWDGWLETHEDDDATSLRIQRLRALESEGDQPFLVHADVADESALRAAVDRVTARFGALNGVVHAAGLPSEQWDRAITAASAEQCQWHFASKAYGQIALEKVLADHDVDFALLLSSLAGVLGGLRLLGYGAANHFMDAAAERANRGLDRTVWISAAWDVWQHHQDEKRAISAIGRSMDDKAIQPEEGLEAVRRLLTLRDVSHVAVSTWDIGHRLDQWVRDERIARPAAGTAATAADAEGQQDADDLVGQVARLVRDALGAEEMPLDADIFEFGGDSLLIVRLLSNLREQFSVEVPLADVLGEPTPGALAALVKERLDARARTVTEAADAPAGSGEDDIESLTALLAALDPADAERLLADAQQDDDGDRHDEQHRQEDEHRQEQER
ncbi:SDR family oxidoreductase [Streptomyces sp. NBC_00237]|uniref:type I polyketide synthase n=1 Tax=Streptomyces sp. NBC_00237 TaxID=2975687 RepID=UPI0022537CF7|nr:type I polyketide synthase [Streptomyces sp. NBC_00237]MCX5205879.1 SDR family oxidoreductase [Streptomyces sp. NBC_00237]